MLDIPSNFEVFFLQGGASMMFAGACLNLLGDKKKANYIVSGLWSRNCFNEAKKYCDPVLVADTYDHANVDISDPSKW